MSDMDAVPMGEDELDALAGRLESLPLDDAVWVARLIAECRRARQAEAAALAGGGGHAADALQAMEQDIAQVVLDAAEWLQTLWNVGYMGAGHFPAAPKSEFPDVGIEDVLNSALLARIRKGRRPLPFPPPTRQGVPWHDVVESDEAFVVDAALVRDEHDAGKVIGAVVEACIDWQVCEEIVVDAEYLVQHQGKGPIYRLVLDPFCSRLERVPPTIVRRILAQDRAGVRTYFLEWPGVGGAPRKVQLRALSDARAESEAQHWLATRHPELYGQVRFELAAVA
jgi:hypothetical protein